MHAPRKQSVKQRNQKRLIGAHKQIMTLMNDQDHKLLNMTIANTLNNTTPKKNQKLKCFKSHNKKKVNFLLDNNQQIPYLEIINPEKSDQSSTLIRSNHTTLQQVNQV